MINWSHAATENPQGSKQIFVNGQHFSGTGYELDGTDNQDAILGIIIVNPSLDSVTETKMTTQNYDAEFGKAVAGILTAQTKSGSNDIHGSGYFYDLDPVDPARNPFTGSPQPNSWKQYGGAVGGAIIKNKLFYFANYEGTRRTQGSSFLVTVPTATVRSTCLTAPVTECNSGRISHRRSRGRRRPGVQPVSARGGANFVRQQPDPAVGDGCGRRLVRGRVCQQLDHSGEDSRATASAKRGR